MPGGVAKPPIARGPAQQTVYVRGQVFRGGVRASKLLFLVKVAVIKYVECRPKLSFGEPNVDDQLLAIESFRPKLGLHGIGRAMQALRRAEHLAFETVGDHYVVADGQAVHASAP